MLREWSDLPSDKDRHAARALFDELERLTHRINEVEREFKQLTGTPSGKRLKAVPDVATLILQFRKQRNKLFPGLFGEPAWDILLSLAALDPAKAEAPVLSIGYAAEVPPTTALRYLAMLEAAGLVERTVNPDDRRSVLVRLTAEGREKVQRMLEKWSLAAIVVVAAPLALLAGFFLR
ncbi:winged helix DNA-binding protein [Sphingomonas sp. MG17]|uniref:Winged helix DNA-binding protein n=1 Tax=Sphingomonas tagetis TaxID=2949092 RepID=A0A9X2HLX2_9SPHN|nr:MarR family transcriptional regulator [Sphingomonas tagetis]MCP3730941.1 winged helix DNA-binding protein [Sphingomonas tagetis]